MITKERLLAGLKELVYVEEGMTTMFVGFAKALVNETRGMDPEKKKEIDKMLSVLYKDSSRHKEMVEKLVSIVEASSKNEY